MISVTCVRAARVAINGHSWARRLAPTQRGPNLHLSVFLSSPLPGLEKVVTTLKVYLCRRFETHEPLVVQVVAPNDVTLLVSARPLNQFYRWAVVVFVCAANNSRESV